MIAYKVYIYDKLKGYELIGILPERRKDPKRITPESVLNWGRMVLGDGADSYNIIFTQVTLEDSTEDSTPRIFNAGTETALPLFI